MLIIVPHFLFRLCTIRIHFFFFFFKFKVMEATLSKLFLHILSEKWSTLKGNDLLPFNLDKFFPF